MPIDAILHGQSYTRPEIDAALAQKQSTLTFDDTPIDNSNNPVKSGGIKTQLDGKMPVAENQESATVGYVLTKTSSGSQWQKVSSEGDTIAAAANSYPVTLLATNWSDHTYVVATPTGATITADCDGILGLAPNASAAQVEAFQLAKIVVTSQDANGVTVVARGQVPTINLNLELTLFMKADYYTKTEEDDLLATKAPLGSPAFTGNPTAPTPLSGDNDTSIATTAFVQGELSAHGLDANGVQISSADDLDDIITTGWYYWTTTVPAHSPTSYGYGSIYIDHAYSNTKQTVFRDNKEYTRTKYGPNAWSAWHEVDTTSLAADLSLHVNATSGNDNNDGLSTETALKTINAAVAKIPKDTAGRVAIISLANGTYAKASIDSFNGITLIIQKESTADVASVIVQGADITNNGHSTIIWSSLTFNAEVTSRTHTRMANGVFSSCVFDGARLSALGDNRISGCTFRNISTQAILVEFGTVSISTLTIENTVSVGVYARQSSIVSISSLNTTNNATTPYETAYSGRIFIGGRTYQESKGVVGLISNAVAIAANADTTITLNQSYSQFNQLALIFYAGSAGSKGIVYVNPNHLTQNAYFPLYCGTTIGWVKLNIVSGSTTSFKVTGTSFTNCYLNYVHGLY